MENSLLQIAVIGGGPAALFMTKRLAESDFSPFALTIFERKSELGSGMPYSREGACNEHVTNISNNEIPELNRGMIEWMKTLPPDQLQPYGIDPGAISEFKVLPRLLFGQYLRNQFRHYLQQLKNNGVPVTINYNSQVADIKKNDEGLFNVTDSKGNTFSFHRIIVCTGHYWPKKLEGIIPNYFDSPYPPSKLAIKTNGSVAIKGSSLTAVDAIKTLALANGTFEDEGEFYKYKLSSGSENFKIVMHSIGGLLPAVRFHFEDQHIPESVLIADEEIEGLKEAHDGFIPLDYIFSRCFKLPLKERQPETYERIKDMKLEAFVEHAMEFRKKIPAFNLLEAEYEEARKSIRRQESVHWKEMLATLSYALNYPAKHMSAEDMMRMKQSLMPLISIVIAFIPQSSCKTLLALYHAGVLDIINVDRSSRVEPLETGGALYHYKNENGEDTATRYDIYVDCIGQQPFSYDEFPFNGLKQQELVSPARVKFKDDGQAAAAKEKGQPVERDEAGHYYLRVPGVCINDAYQLIDKYGAAHPEVFLMAVPLIAGLNPDYSGLDFCEAASERIVDKLIEQAELSLAPSMN